MKRGFTIIELLVASLLAGMLMTILTMIFNQSSIAWRTGIAGTTNMDMARQGTAELCDQADNAIRADDGNTYLLQGVWDMDGNVNTRGVATKGTVTYMKRTLADVNESDLQNGVSSTSVGGGTGSGAVKNWIVNVMSAGPDRTFDTYDDIWSVPDEFE